MDKIINILLVENDAVDQMAVQRWVSEEKLPYKLEIVETCAKAIGSLQEKDFDLILLDYSLSDGTGLDLLPKTGNVPVIFISGSGTMEVAIQAMREGAYDYMIKDTHRNYLTLLPENIRNVLRRKKIDDQMKRYSEELKRSNQDLEDFAFTVTHDLQEPLRKAASFSDLLREESSKGQLGERGRDYLERIVKSVLHMRGFINDLLEYSRVGKNSDPFQSVDLGQVVRDMAGLFELTLTSLGGRVEVEKLPVIKANKLQMAQLFQNLISNGLKYQKAGNPPVITITAFDLKDGFHQISVADNGIGFDVKNLDRIFQPFERLHGKKEFGGYGIGLALCRKIVDRHGGTLTAQSIVGEGSTFIITLPETRALPPRQ